MRFRAEGGQGPNTIPVSQKPSENPVLLIIMASVWSGVSVGLFDLSNDLALRNEGFLTLEWAFSYPAGARAHDRNVIIRTRYLKIQLAFVLVLVSEALYKDGNNMRVQTLHSGALSVAWCVPPHLKQTGHNNTTEFLTWARNA